MRRFSGHGGVLLWVRSCQGTVALLGWTENRPWAGGLLSSDRGEEFVECDFDSPSGCGLEAEFVVAAAHILDKRVALDHGARCAVAFQARIGRSRAFNRPWSASTRLLAYWTVLCNASGASSPMALASAAARSVTTSDG